jgi:phospholipid transport system substrate-binding protein
MPYSFTNFRLRASVIMFSLLLCSSVMADTKQAAVGTIERLHETLLEVMQQASNLGFKGRVEKLTPVVEESFDLQTISRIVTGQHWKTIDEEKRKSFVDVFHRLSAATYASNFSSFSGEQFKTLGAEEKRGRYIVRTAIVKSDGEEIPLDYVVSDNDGVWQIVNVIAAGVSDLSLKRADYTAVINSEGFDSLLARLNDKIASFE